MFLVINSRGRSIVGNYLETWEITYSLDLMRLLVHLLNVEPKAIW